MKKAKGASLPSEVKGADRYGRLAYKAMLFVALFIFWLIICEHYEVRYLVMGALLAGLVTFMTGDLFYPNSTVKKKEAASIRLIFVSSLSMLAYLPWLLLNIIKANLQVALLILNPRMPIEPILIRFKVKYQREISAVTLANSITLTPGTITVELINNTYIIHALVPESAEDLESGLMQNKVGRVFDEREESPPEVLRAYSMEKFK